MVLGCQLSFNRFGTLGKSPDDISSDGIYSITSGNELGLPVDTGILIQFSSDGGAGGKPKLQLVASYYQNNKTALRIKWGDAWSAWKTVSLL